MSTSSLGVPTLAAMARGGLVVRSVAGDFRVRVRATDDVSEVGPVDHVLFCVKSYDTEEAAARLGRLLAEDRFREHVDRVFPLEEAAEAHRYLEERRNRGKVLLDPRRPA